MRRRELVGQAERDAYALIGQLGGLAEWDETSCPLKLRCAASRLEPGNPEHGRRSRSVPRLRTRRRSRISLSPPSELRVSFTSTG